MRAAATLRNAAKAKPMSADHTKYHLAPTGFWKKFRDAVVVNPEISSGLPLPDVHRYPQPGSRPEHYATPATQASDVAFNPYYKRDARRAYPQTTYITQSTLSSLLLSSPSLASLPSPSSQNQNENASAITPSSDASASAVPALSEVLGKLPAGQAFIGGGVQTAQAQAQTQGLPPTPPKVGKKWVPQPGGEIPHGEFAYFPMIGYK